MDDSPLNKLAAELRNEIYRYALAEDQHVVLLGRDTPHFYYGQNTKPKIRLALTRTCKQIRSEGLLVFLGDTEFVLQSFPTVRWIYGPEILERDVLGWLAHLGPWAASLRHVQVDMSTVLNGRNWAWSGHPAAIYTLRRCVTPPKLKLSVTATQDIWGLVFSEVDDYTLSVDFNGGSNERILQRLESDGDRLKMMLEDSMKGRAFYNREKVKEVAEEIQHVQDEVAMVLGRIDGLESKQQGEKNDGQEEGKKPDDSRD